MVVLLDSAQLFLEILQHDQDTALNHHVERGGRLVGQDKLGLDKGGQRDNATRVAR
ncbi:MAG: hypothetical protein NT075_33560 [Chloroflexi bacterium]|nr:hypothetical protein [Chloroflexota bacterium]